MDGQHQSTSLTHRPTDPNKKKSSPPPKTTTATASAKSAKPLPAVDWATAAAGPCPSLLLAAHPAADVASPGSSLLPCPAAGPPARRQSDVDRRMRESEKELELDQITARIARAWTDSVSPPSSPLPCPASDGLNSPATDSLDSTHGFMTKLDQSLNATLHEGEVTAVKRSMTGSEETVAPSDDSSICTMDGLEMVAMRPSPSPIRETALVDSSAPHHYHHHSHPNGGGRLPADNSNSNSGGGGNSTGSPYRFEAPVVVHVEDGYTVLPTSLRKALYWKRNGGPIVPADSSQQMAPLALMERLSSECSSSVSETVSLLVDETGEAGIGARTTANAADDDDPQVVVVPDSPHTTARTYSTESGGPNVSCDSLLSVRERRPLAVSKPPNFVPAGTAVTFAGDQSPMADVKTPSEELALTPTLSVDATSSSAAVTMSKPPLVRIAGGGAAPRPGAPRSPDAAKKAAMLTAIQKMASAAAQGALPINPNAGPAWLNIDVTSVSDLCASYGVCDTCMENDEKMTFAGIAERYCNVHYNNGGYIGAIAKTVNAVRGRAYSDTVPPEDLLRFSKSSSLTTSLIRFFDQDNNILACSIFKDICRYMRGDVRGAAACSLLQGIMETALERIEMRDEVICQLIRQTTDNSNTRSLERAWHIMCLACASFSPSRTLCRCLQRHLRRLECESSGLSRFAAYCSRALSRTCQTTRRLSPCTAEIEAVCLLQPVTYKVYFLDGTFCMVELQPYESVADVIGLVKENLGLASNWGWALYESSPDIERHIHDSEYIIDVLARWERKLQECVQTSSPKRQLSVVNTLPPVDTYGRLVFCRRLFSVADNHLRDPVEIHQLYIQAVHHVVQLDDLRVSSSVGMHLAGLQMQVEFGDYDDQKEDRYKSFERFIPQRLLINEFDDWSAELAAAHKRYGKGKTSKEAELKYIMMASQCPLYGVTYISVTYLGMWPFGEETVLAVNYDGIKYISVQQKVISYEFTYSEIELIVLPNPVKGAYIIIQLRDTIVSEKIQKCFLFRSDERDTFAELIECYAKHLATWTKDELRPRLTLLKCEPPADCLHLHDCIVDTRQALIDRGVIVKRSHDGAGILRGAFRFGGGTSPARDETDVDNFWSFSRMPFQKTLTPFRLHEWEDTAVRMFNSSLVYAGIESLGVLHPSICAFMWTAAMLEETDLIIVAQTLLIKCLDNDSLCNEIFLQLMKQTTRPSSVELSTKTAVRFWHLLTMALCIMVPANPVVFNYLVLHLRKSSLLLYTEEGAFAQFCIHRLYRTQKNNKRKYPPSQREIAAVTKRQMMQSMVHLSNGQSMVLQYDSAMTAAEAVRLLKAQCGMRLDGEGYGLYALFGETENYIVATDKLADSVYKWEGWVRTSRSQAKEMRFMFRKRLFVEPYMNLNDPSELSLLYHQLSSDVFEQKIPLTRCDATQLCALRAQCEYGCQRDGIICDYAAVMRILPRHLRDLIRLDDVMANHKRLGKMSQFKAQIDFLRLLQLWPLFGSVMFEVDCEMDQLPSQSSYWLAVSQIGIHLMEFRGPEMYMTYTYDDISHCKPTNKALAIYLRAEDASINGNLDASINSGLQPTTESIVVMTSQGAEINQLIIDYKELLQLKKQQATDQPCTSAQASQQV